MRGIDPYKFLQYLDCGGTCASFVARCLYFLNEGDGIATQVDVENWCESREKWRKILANEQYVCDPIFFWEMVDCGIVSLINRNLTRVKPEWGRKGITRRWRPITFTIQDPFRAFFAFLRRKNRKKIKFKLS